MNRLANIHGSYQYLPVVAAVTWFITLLILLVYWLAEGQPEYPSMEGNIAFISDVGAQILKPLFVLGTIITGVCFFLSLVSVHYLQHQSRGHRRYCKNSSPSSSDETFNSRSAPTPRLPPNIRRAEKIFAYMALVGTFTASAGVILLSGFDTLRYLTLHRVFLAVFMLGIFFAVIGNVTQFLLLYRSHRDHKFLRVSAFLKLMIGVIFVVLAAAFATRLGTSARGTSDTESTGSTAGSRRNSTGYNQAAVLEWVIGFVFTFYILTLWYDLRHATPRDSPPASPSSEHEKLEAGSLLHNRTRSVDANGSPVPKEMLRLQTTDLNPREGITQGQLH